VATGRRHSRSDDAGPSPIVLVGAAIAVATVLALVVTMFKAKWFQGLAVLPSIVSLGLVLLGALGIARCAWSKPLYDLRSAAAPIALVLAGGMLGGGGWGAALGLGLLGAAAVLADARKPASPVDEQDDNRG